MKEEWLMPGAVVPVDVETTAALVAEIKRLIGVVGDMALNMQPAQQQEPVEYVRKMIDALYENGDPVSVEAAELLERMEQPEQEPAAWVETREDGSIYWGCETDTVISDDPSWLERPVPVYFAPPPRKPLTDEQIEDLYFDKFSMSELKAFARAIEAAHGIKEKNNG